MPNGRSSTRAVGTVAIRPKNHPLTTGKGNGITSSPKTWNPPSPDIQLIAGSLCKREKLPWREADDSPHSAPKLRMRAATPTRPHMSLWNAEGQLYLCHNHGSSGVKLQVRLGSIFGESDSK
jgi:hypothetical protein